MIPLQQSFSEALPLQRHSQDRAVLKHIQDDRNGHKLQKHNGRPKKQLPKKVLEVYPNDAIFSLIFFKSTAHTDPLYFLSFS